MNQNVLAKRDRTALADQGGLEGVVVVLARLQDRTGEHSGARSRSGDDIVDGQFGLRGELDDDGSRCRDCQLRGRLGLDLEGLFTGRSACRTSRSHGRTSGIAAAPAAATIATAAVATAAGIGAAAAIAATMATAAITTSLAPVAMTEVTMPATVAAAAVAAAAIATAAVSATIAAAATAVATAAVVAAAAAATVMAEGRQVGAGSQRHHQNNAVHAVYLLLNNPRYRNMIDARSRVRDQPPYLCYRRGLPNPFTRCGSVKLR
jgi:hypothetical protein